MTTGLKLDPVEQGLVDLAVARYREVVAQAEREMNQALAPLRAKYAVDRLELEMREDGTYLLAGAPEESEP